MNRADLAALLGVPESELDQALADLYSSFPESNPALAPQMERAQGMADAPMSGGQMVGRYFVPTSPLASMAQAIGKGVGGFQLSKLQGQQSALLDALRRSRKIGGVGQAGLDMGPEVQPPEPELKDPWGVMDEPADPLASIPFFLRRPQG